GMAVAARNLGIDRQHIAVIGDGAMTAGMVFEALNNAGDTEGINLLVILNDNDMSISPPVGALNKYFSRLISSGLPLYKEASDMSKVMLERMPEPMAELARRFKGHVKEQAKSLMGGTSLFDEFGFSYVGPIDGHDLDALLPVLSNVKRLGGLQFVHVITKKGNGYELAEEDPVLYHGPGKFDPSEGIKSSGAVAKQTFTQVFGHWLCDMAAADDKLIGITPAMREGSGLVEFEQRFPKRYFDVGIAEQHAVTFAGGIACEGLKPVVAIYSTFLQRAYDQLIHDVALQNLDVTFALDRAGLVGADGATHAGNYDIVYLRCIPNMVVAVPSDEQESRLLLSTCYHYEGPASVRYPRGAGIGATTSTALDVVPLGKAISRRQGSKVAILAFGPLLHEAMSVADKYDLSLIDMRFVKPLDEEMLVEIASSHQAFVTLEEGALMGGAGSAVIEFLNRRDINLPVLQLAYPDLFIDHGDQNALRAQIGLDAMGIEQSIQHRFAEFLK
ncbi:MAG: 1-deoxy-D-xylulose-5-phosphate synthase, partial [Alcaligenaceae bacterium]|nr:1-deoxy-D-xylulose-5-phosphate synthase [Alcaligenaceae bacterium]